MTPLQRSDMFKTNMSNLKLVSKGLEKPETNQAYNALVETALSSDQFQCALGPKEQDYTSGMLTVSRSVSSDDVRRTLLGTTLNVLAAGIPGLAGVAIAKSIAHALESPGITPDQRGEVAQSGMASLMLGSDIETVGPARIASEVFSKNEIPLHVRDTIAAEGMKSIAGLENWNIA